MSQKKILIYALVFGLLVMFLLVGLRELVQARRMQSELKLANLELKVLAVENKDSSYLAEGDIPYIIRQLISTLPQGLSLELRRIIPQKIKPAGKLKKFEVEIEIVSRQSNLEKYLGKLSLIKTPAQVNRVIIKRVDNKSVASKSFISFLLVPGAATVNISPEAFSKPRPKRKTVQKTYEKKVKLPVLQGIWSGEVTQAIIDDQVVGVGQSVNGFLVVDIQPDYVVIKKSGKKYYLKLK